MFIRVLIDPLGSTASTLRMRTRPGAVSSTLYIDGRTLNLTASSTAGNAFPSIVSTDWNAIR